jgi:predicted helicase
MLLKETGFKYFNNRRLGIYLTNSLQEGNTIEDMFGGFGLAESISQESKEASVIKNDKPIMVVLGNPPYSGVSSNETSYANGLVEKYKKEPSGGKLKEKKHWLNDDYVKFIAFAENLIEKKGTGVLAFINNHSFIDNPTFRGMRYHLQKTFDDIYIIDLHGNSKKKETAPDGSKDENVFDIQQGVSINIFVKTGKKDNEQIGNVWHTDVYGERKDKFDMLGKRQINDMKFAEVKNREPFYFFKPINQKGREEYDSGFGIEDLFKKYTTGIVTAIDRLSICQTEEELLEKTNAILNSENPYEEFNIKDQRKHKKEERLEELRNAVINGVKEISYRPFDKGYMYYTQKSECWINSPRFNVMQHLIKGPNIALLVGRQGQVVGDVPWNLSFVANSLVDFNVFYRGGEQVFPLYLYLKDGEKISNLRTDIVTKINTIVENASPEDILNYVYSILYNPAYRTKYGKFLKSDFPRIPYPKDRKTFYKLAKLGNELIQYHLLEHEDIDPYQISYLGEGDNVVDKPEYKNDKVYINPTQYFGNVSEIAWNFYIGGYQPAQKWLKDRKGKELTPDDIEHYAKIVIVLKETDRIMKEIDKISFR